MKENVADEMKKFGIEVDVKDVDELAKELVLAKEELSEHLKQEKEIRKRIAHAQKRLMNVMEILDKETWRVMDKNITISKRKFYQFPGTIEDKREIFAWLAERFGENAIAYHTIHSSTFNDIVNKAILEEIDLPEIIAEPFEKKTFSVTKVKK